jgi:hypothetical protein
MNALYLGFIWLSHNLLCQCTSSICKLLWTFISSLPCGLQYGEMVLVGMHVFIPTSEGVFERLPRRSLFVEIGANLMKYLSGAR